MANNVDSTYEVISLRRGSRQAYNLRARSVIRSITGKYEARFCFKSWRLLVSNYYVSSVPCHRFRDCCVGPVESNASREFDSYQAVQVYVYVNRYTEERLLFFLPFIQVTFVYSQKYFFFFLTVFSRFLFFFVKCVSLSILRGWMFWVDFRILSKRMSMFLMIRCDLALVISS